MKKTYKSLLIGIMVGLLASPQLIFAAASGHYTDLLPVGAPGDTTVISNGSGWSITTLPPTQTFGDSLSRIVDVVYQATAPATINATITPSTFTALGQGNVGSTTFPASWVATGRSIRGSIKGRYATTSVAQNWTWAVKLGTTTILNTTAVLAASNQANQWFSAEFLMTVDTAGANGTVSGSYDIFVGSNTLGSSVINYSTVTTSAVGVDLTSQLTVNPVFTWGTGVSSMTIQNAIIEFLN